MKILLFYKNKQTWKFVINNLKSKDIGGFCTERSKWKTFDFPFHDWKSLSMLSYDLELFLLLLQFRGTRNVDR